MNDPALADLALASEFPAATREAWRAAAERVLKGADFDRKLVGRSADGFMVEPIYERADAPAAVPGRPAAPWRIVQRVDHPDAAEANALALADLEGGADGLAIVGAGAGAARGFGIGTDGGSLNHALEGVMLDLVAVRLDAGSAGPAAAAALLALTERRGHRPGELDLDLGLDPVGAAARSGAHPDDPALGLGTLGALATDLAERGFAGRVAMADGRPYHEAGGSEAGELAAVLATALAYLRAFESAGLDLPSARARLSFLLVADADEFMSVAKFRALRRLWACVETACGLDPAPLRLHAETAWRMTTRRDPWVNLLRGTLAAFSAAVGGADDIAVLPFTAALGLPDAFARRIARNTQLILAEEANIWRVADPAAGSGAFEALTDGLVEEAWAQFGEIEREGGIVRSLGSGALGDRIAAVRRERARAIATRRAPLTGTSEFPDIREAPIAVLMPRAPRTENGAAPARAGFEPLPSWRAAEPFEALRDRSDALLEERGRRPAIFLATLGPLPEHLARATFAKNAFEAGGIEAIAPETALAPEMAAQAFTTSGAALACLCSSDEIYAAEAEATARALRTAGARLVFLAGRPGEHEAAWREAGITGYLGIGSDLAAILDEAMAAA